MSGRLVLRDNPTNGDTEVLKQEGQQTDVCAALFLDPLPGARPDAAGPGIDPLPSSAPKKAGGVVDLWKVAGARRVLVVVDVDSHDTLVEMGQFVERVKVLALATTSCGDLRPGERAWGWSAAGSAQRVDPRSAARTRRARRRAAPPIRRGAPTGGRPDTTSPDWSSFVSPPCSHARTWWTSHHDGGRPHRAQPPSRAATARRRPSGMVRVARPTSNGWPAPPNTTGTTAASQASIRSDAGRRVPPKSRQRRGRGAPDPPARPPRSAAGDAHRTRTARRCRRGRAPNHRRRPTLRPGAGGGAVILGGARLRPARRRGWRSRRTSPHRRTGPPACPRHRRGCAAGTAR